MKYGFDNDKYISIQSQHIQERIAQFSGKLYLELGGKLFDDYHACRVLPGFQPDSKLRMLQQLSASTEIVIVISALDIEKNKVRQDLGITYDEDVLRLRTEFQKRGFVVNGVVITHYNGQNSAAIYRRRLEHLGIRAYYHYNIEGYPNNVPLINSDEGFGRNDYVETTRPLVIVTAPGPGSGKMAVCLSQLYAERKRGIEAGYAKFETFPVWNLPLSHPVNLAYEAATVDLDDVNMIDPFHFEAYGKTTVNYNRDVEVFPVLQAILEGIMGECPYKSPTDMGVNMVGFAISDDEACREASKQEIIRRYYQTAVAVKRGTSAKSELVKEELLLSKAGCKPEERLVTGYADAKAAESNGPAVAIELPDGRIVTGRTNDLMGAASSCLMNTLKTLAGIPDEEKLVAESAIIPIQTLKTDYLHGKNPRLHTDETLIALSVSAATNADAKKAMDQIPALYGAQAHSTVMLSHVDEALFKKLGIMLTETPVMESRD